MYKIGFILEQALGHITHSQNLQQYISKDPEVTPYWGLPAMITKGWTAKIPFIRNNWTLQAGLQTRRFLAKADREVHLDALFFHTQVTAVLAQDWLIRIPGIVSLDATPLQYDSLGSFYTHGTGPEWIEMQKWRLNRDCFQHAQRLVTWSEWAAQGLVDGYGVSAEKITVIPPGVDAQAWARPNPRRPRSGPVKILFVGGSLERKGGWLLLEAFRIIREWMHRRNSSQGREPGIELHLVTKDDLPSRPGVSVYNHMQPNSMALKQLYYESDIFCLPTRGDCLPMVLSEAGCAGLPVISTRLAGIPEIVKDGVNGFLIPPDDMGKLVEALQRLITNQELRLSMGERAVELTRKHFDAEQNAFRLLTLIKETIEEARTCGDIR